MFCYLCVVGAESTVLDLMSSTGVEYYIRVIGFEHLLDLPRVIAFSKDMLNNTSLVGENRQSHRPDSSGVIDYYAVPSL